MKKKSFYTEIIEFLEEKHKDIHNDKHYSHDKKLSHLDMTPNQSAYHCLSDVIGYIKAIKGLRDYESKKIKKKKNEKR